MSNIATCSIPAQHPIHNRMVIDTIFCLSVYFLKIYLCIYFFKNRNLNPNKEIAESQGMRIKKAIMNETA